MREDLEFILFVLIIVIFFLLRRKKGIFDFKRKVPNFISFCNQNGWKLVDQKTTGLVYCKEVDYKKLKSEYLKFNAAPLELPEGMIIYHYIGLYCGGEFLPISTDQRDFSRIRFINDLSVTNYISVEFPVRDICQFKDNYSVYEREVEYGWNGLVSKLFYMIKSDNKNRNGRGGGWYSLYMKESELRQWQQLANDSEIPSTMRAAITELFIPNKISILKYTVNQDATSDPFRHIIYRDKTLFSKTLKIFQENTLLKAAGYPNWFYLAFPDVAMWSIKGEGYKLLEEKFKDLTLNELIYNNYIKLEHLQTIVNLYKQNVHTPLEVSTNSDY